MAVQNAGASSGTLRQSGGSDADQRWRAAQPLWPIGQSSAPPNRPRKYVTHCKYCGAHRSISNHPTGSFEFACGTYTYLMGTSRKYTRSALCHQYKRVQQNAADYQDQIARLQQQLMMREHDISVMLEIITGMSNARDSSEV